ncbi:SDR family oxidoreductase [Rhodocytophaga rosea]|uniref:SDR family oxidoreductase n=1 Tax=Rhodocytophaga rosea TaxID=2704465 RepID=A0A6C0GDB2_9BACT|nr:SDR family oxidoreductase [Rhodocytophaga rosea]QHT65888.1 SDR family oxidoreductase [Rhodocytophaga rosea]
MRLQGKVVVVSGSCMGIGKAIAQRCVAEGARVVIHGLEAELGEEVVNQLKKNKAALHIEDIAAPGAPEKLVSVALQNFGRLDAIVNNAAIVVPSNIHTTDLDFFRRILEVNTLAPFALIQAALPYLIQAKGCVLNIGSVNAWCGEPDLLAYSVSKGALMTLTRNLGDTLQRDNGVRVNQINPGWVLTEKEISRKQEQGFAADWYKDISDMFAPAGRILQPSEIAAAAVYWLSDESGPISGQVVDLEQYPLIGRNPPKSLFPTKPK